MNLNDTISAISTPIGEGGISVTRISGSNSFGITEKIFFKDTARNRKISIQETASHTIHFGYLFDGENQIDEVMVSIFKKPNSYTGEDTIEISSHGGVLVTQKILSLTIKSGARHAEPGEFTKRAFLNKRLDLSQAEAVADLIKAKTDSAHESSLKQLEGSLSKYISTVRQEIIDATSLIELELDFSEEDIEFVPKDEFRNKISGIVEKLNEIISSYISGKIIRDGINLVISGRTNSGKSSLFNQLLKSDRAIVSNISGTTRDYLQENIVIDGILFNLIDTAGIRQSEDVIETEGIKRSFRKIEEADFILYLIDSTESMDFIENEAEYFKNNFDLKKSIPVFTKKDIGKVRKGEISISVYDEGSIKELKSSITGKINESANVKTGSEIILTNLRHKLCIESVVNSLEQVISGIDRKMSGEFISVDLRNALNYLGEITGEVTNEEILNNIFKNFCIGK
ncbi:MAG: tRNA uridine-5-carboxymethylaminomethyl(34) synthesis GTPase MnmE [Ignavibacteriae bacterium]|nr:tRNA uridine-5-carboxymethylaminomethyl(34) synthesis GTPase MnmE [Ignavibacteriota bacterium]